MFNAKGCGAIIISTMRLLSQNKALGKLRRISADFADRIRKEFEHRAMPCVSCVTPGACCLDAHFVNVHISRLEAVAINQTLDSLPAEKRNAVFERVESTITEYGLNTATDTFGQKYTCPLFEKGIGCLVHDSGKPVACTIHACYENEADLPPSELQSMQELRIDKLNSRTYATPQPWLPIPLAIRRID